MGRHDNEALANERSEEEIPKKKKWPRRLRFFKTLGHGLQSSASTGGEAVSCESSSEYDARMHFGALLEVLLDEKAKTLGSMIDEMRQIRVPSLRKISTPPASDIITRRHPMSSTSSADSVTTYQRALERNESSLMEREEMLQSFKSRSATSDRGLGTGGPTSQPRHVQSETHEDLPQAPGPIGPPALQLPIRSLHGSSWMETPVSENFSLTPATEYPQLSMPFISYDELQVKCELGRGQFASVKLSFWKGVQVALKEWHTMTDTESMEMACREGSTLACLRHPCVVSFYGMLNHGPSPGLVVEYLPHLSLKSKLTELRGGHLDTKKLKVAVALRAARGMEFLHSRKVIHFDLKCENLLCDLRDLENPIVKIGDVGLSKEKMRTFVSGNMRGTLPWMAPELFPNVDRVSSQGNITDLVNEKVDVYSFGVVLWEIWEMGETPYPDLDAVQLLEGIVQGNLSLRCPNGCDPVWSEVMYECLRTAPERRPDFPNIVSRLKTLCDEDTCMEDI